MSYTTRNSKELQEIQYKIKDLLSKMQQVRNRYLDLDVKLTALKFERERLQNESRKNN